MEVSWAGGLHTCSSDWCDMHMRRRCLPELQADTAIFPFSEWEYILCHHKSEIFNLFFFILQDVTVMRLPLVSEETLDIGTVWVVTDYEDH